MTRSVDQSIMWSFNVSFIIDNFMLGKFSVNYRAKNSKNLKNVPSRANCGRLESSHEKMADDSQCKYFWNEKSRKNTFRFLNFIFYPFLYRKWSVFISAIFLFALGGGERCNETMEEEQSCSVEHQKETNFAGTWLKPREMIIRTG